jgi:hypothetical protein
VLLDQHEAAAEAYKMWDTLSEKEKRIFEDLAKGAPLNETDNQHSHGPVITEKITLHTRFCFGLCHGRAHLLPSNHCLCSQQELNSTASRYAVLTSPWACPFAEDAQRFQKQAVSYELLNPGWFAGWLRRQEAADRGAAAAAGRAAVPPARPRPPLTPWMAFVQATITKLKESNPAVAASVSAIELMVRRPSDISAAASI